LGLARIANNFKSACYWKETADFITKRKVLSLPLLILGLKEHVIGLKDFILLKKTRE